MAATLANLLGPGTARYSAQQSEILTEQLLELKRHNTNIQSARNDSQFHTRQSRISQLSNSKHVRLFRTDLDSALTTKP